MTNKGFRAVKVVMKPVLLLTVVLSLVQTQRLMGPAPMPAAAPSPVGAGYPQVQSSHCRYLINAPSPWGTNASPFKLYTRSYSGMIRRGYPVEVSILPFYEAFKFFNFTDFALWAEPQFSGGHLARGGSEMQWGGGAAAPPPSPSVSHLGVWQVYPQYAGGAGSMKCNMYSSGEDTVGSFESRMLELLQTQFPGDPRLTGFKPSARHGAAFLWYPDEQTMRSGSIKFVAKLKSFGHWFKLESSPWRVRVPPPPPRPFNTGSITNNFNTFLEQYSNMNQKAIAFERKMEQAGNGAL